MAHGSICSTLASPFRAQSMLLPSLPGIESLDPSENRLKVHPHGSVRAESLSVFPRQNEVACRERCPSQAVA